MTETANRPPTGGFNPLVPEFDVFDVPASLRFWCEGLGFRVAYDRPEAGFAFLEREGAQVMLNAIDGEWETGALEYPLGRGLNFEIEVSSLTPILEALERLNWPLYAPVRERWRVTGDREGGGAEFLVQDPNGYLLRFTQDLGERPRSEEKAFD